METKLFQEVELLSREICGDNRIEREVKMKFGEYVTKEDFVIPAELNCI